MIYNAIGLMSGSSMDGLDIAFVSFLEENGVWSYQWLATECIVYSEELLNQLKVSKNLDVQGFLRLHTSYGHHIGSLVSEFVKQHQDKGPALLIASHGHTVFHDPANHTTFQLGDGAAIAAETSLPVVSDLRNMDIAYGGQGAPIVPLGEKLLFPEFDYWLNLGGIANFTFQEAGEWKAFDICACNQVLNAIVAERGLLYDEDGKLAEKGTLNTNLFYLLNQLEHFSRPIPKSLDNSFSQKSILPLINEFCYGVEDRLRTALEHIVFQISMAIPASQTPKKLLVTGGGALNIFMIQRLSDLLVQKGISVVIPDIQTIQFKEALIMALLGVLRWKGLPTVLHSATGARESSVGGALWLPK